MNSIEFIGAITGTTAILMPVAIVWIVMHYTSKRREAKTLLTEESEALESLLNAADRMEKRIDSLEKILDADDINWKDKTQ